MEFTLIENDIPIFSDSDFYGVLIVKKQLENKNPDKYYKIRNNENRITWSEIYHNIIDFNIEIIPNWREQHPVFFSNALAGEVGEICNLTKKLAGGGTNRISETEIKEKLKLELGDVFAYFICLSEVLGLDETELKNQIHEKHLIIKNRIRGV